MTHWSYCQDKNSNTSLTSFKRLLKRGKPAKNIVNFPAYFKKKATFQLRIKNVFVFPVQIGGCRISDKDTNKI